MRKILIFGVICFLFIAPLYAEEFTLKKSLRPETAFRLLQYSAWGLIDLDTVLTYRLVGRYGLSAEANPFWRNILDKPALVFAIDMVIKVGIVWGTSKLYKKNKLLAYVIIVAVNISYISVACLHFKVWRQHR